MAGCRPQLHSCTATAACNISRVLNSATCGQQAMDSKQSSTTATLSGDCAAAALCLRSGWHHVCAECQWHQPLTCQHTTGQWTPGRQAQPMPGSKVKEATTSTVIITLVIKKTEQKAGFKSCWPVAAAGVAVPLQLRPTTPHGCECVHTAICGGTRLLTVHMSTLPHRFHCL